MTWWKADDRLPEHPKILRVGKDGLALFVRAGCYCARNLTDGFLPEAVVAALTYDMDLGAAGMARIMVGAGLWEAAEGGFRVHDYLDYNPARARVQAERESAAERMSRVRRKFGRTSPNPVPDPVPVTTTTTPPSPPAGGERPRRARKAASSDHPAFEAFWSAYPPHRRRGRQEALQAWRKLNPTPAQVEQVMASLASWKRCDDWLKDDGKYIPWPQKFINRGRWQETVEDRPTFRAERV